MAPIDSPLLKLAGELRNKIYRYALTDVTMDVNRDNIRKHTGLLQTCRQIRQEASGIFYAENRFVVTIETANYAHLTQWLEMIGPHRAGLVTQLNINPHWRLQEFWQKLKGLIALQRAATTARVRGSYGAWIRAEWGILFLEWRKVLIEMAKSMQLAGLKVDAIVKFTRVNSSSKAIKQVFLQYLQNKMILAKSDEKDDGLDFDLEESVAVAVRNVRQSR